MLSATKASLMLMVPFQRTRALLNLLIPEVVLYAEGREYKIAPELFAPAG